MKNVWVYKFDGTIQCMPEVQETSLEKMREELASLIGDKNILSMEKGQRQVIQLCNFPTGKINCYEITQEGWSLLETGIRGPCGFERMDHGPKEADGNVNLGRLIGSLTALNPNSVQDLVGHPLRTYKTGDLITYDWRPNRCNIELDDSHSIVKVWFG